MRRLLAFLIMFAALSCAAFAEVPKLINYQGYITDDDGVPVNGTKTVIFRLYDVAAGGTPLWSETHTVTAQNGVFNVLLGSMPGSELDGLAFDQQYYVEIVVDGTQLNPRMALASAAYAIRSGASDDAGIPSGVITMWSGAITEIPDGWALCDGTNSTPNLMDKFIVGAGSTYAVAATGGEVTHTLTIAEMPNHYHQAAAYHNAGQTGRFLSSSGGDDSTANTYATGGSQPHENRPPYYALAYIMKI